MVHLLNASVDNNMCFQEQEWLMQCKKLNQKQGRNIRWKKEMKRGALMPGMLFELLKIWSCVSANSEESYRWLVIFRINAVPVFRGLLVSLLCCCDRHHAYTIHLLTGQTASISEDKSTPIKNKTAQVLALYEEAQWQWSHKSSTRQHIKSVELLMLLPKGCSGNVLYRCWVAIRILDRFLRLRFSFLNGDKTSSLRVEQLMLEWQKNMLRQVGKSPHIEEPVKQNQYGVCWGQNEGQGLLMWSYSSSALWQQYYKSSC